MIYVIGVIMNDEFQTFFRHCEENETTEGSSFDEAISSVGLLRRVILPSVELRSSQ
jgi:hypothetical protein